MVSFLAGLLIGAGTGAAMSGVQAPLNIGFNKLVKPTPNDPNTLVNLRYRNEITQDYFIEEMSAHGFNENNANQMLKGQSVLIDINELIRLFRRGKLGNSDSENKSEYLRRALALGVENQTASDLITATEVIETPQQIITFLVREVLNPKLRKQLELDLEFPEESIKEFAKLGIQEELARRIWAAHWTLPAFDQIARAAHRYSPSDKKFWNEEVKELGLEPERVETEIDDLSDLLKFQDVGTFYRQKVLATIFEDLGQIQLRWLIRFRFFSYEEAVYRHKRQGLPANLAALVTKVVFVVQSITDWRDGIKQGAFTFDDVTKELNDWKITEKSIIDVVKRKVSPEITEGVSDERRLSKSVFFQAYDLGETNRTELIDNLKAINYDDTQAKFMVEVHDAKLQLDAIKESRRGGLTKADIKRGFREGKFSKDESIKRLIDAGMEKEAARQLIEIEELALNKKEEKA